MLKSLLPQDWNNYNWSDQWRWIIVHYNGEESEKDGTFHLSDDIPTEIKEEFERLEKKRIEHLKNFIMM